jgi:CRP/FNR family transcriptional regulator, cyclic AMP receptor protein
MTRDNGSTERGSAAVDKLIEESSFGTAEVHALRELAPKAAIDAITSRAGRGAPAQQESVTTRVSVGTDTFAVLELTTGLSERLGGRRVVRQPMAHHGSPTPYLRSGNLALIDRGLVTELAWPSNSLLGHLSEGPRQELLNLGTVVRYPTDKEIIEQDASDTHAFLLLDGVVKVQASDETGNTALLSIRVAGDLVGEMAALDQKPRSATVMTCGEVMAKMISSAELTAFLLRRSEAFLQLFAITNNRLRWADDRRRDFLSYPAAERVARVVYELVQTYGREEPEGWVLGIPMTKVELASLAGMKPRTAERAFSDLRKAGVVVSHLRRNVVVPDLERLREFASR